jgi:hypothetical protein
MMFPAVPDSINFAGGGQQRSATGNTKQDNSQADSFDDLTNRFNQLKKN